MRETRTLLVATMLFVNALAVGHAQQAQPLTPLDYFEINQLYARYAHGMDRGLGAVVADVFAPDGVYLGPNGQRVEGRDELMSFASADPARRKGVTNVSHLLANVQLEPTPQGATGRSYVLFADKPLEGEPRGLITAGGQFWDDLVRTRDGWRIRRRVYVPAGGRVPVLPPLPAPGPAPARDPSTLPILTAEDYVGIYQLYADYGHTYDTATNRGYDWADLFTPDGVHVATANPLEYIRGADLLAAFAYRTYRLTGGFATLNLDQDPVKTWVSAAHNQTSLLVTPTDEGVVTRVFRITGGLDRADRATLIPGGVYHDLLIKDPDRWRFKESWYVLPGRPVPELATRFIDPNPRSRPTPSARQDAPDEVGGFSAAAYVEIQQLYARTAYALDAASDNGDAYANLFVPEGTHTEQDGTAHAGRAALAAFARSDSQPKGPTNVEHVLWQVRFARTPDGAEGVAYVMTVDVREDGQPARILNAGQYRDTLVDTPNGWRLRTRSFHRTEEVR